MRLRDIAFMFQTLVSHTRNPTTAHPRAPKHRARNMAVPAPDAQLGAELYLNKYRHASTDLPFVPIIVDTAARRGSLLRTSPTMRGSSPVKVRIHGTKHQNARKYKETIIPLDSNYSDVQFEIAKKKLSRT